MLLIKTNLAQSTVHGLGLVAAEEIARGTEIWRFEEGFDQLKTTEEVAKLPPVARDWWQQFAYLDRNLNQYILSFDHGRFINHSDDPNVRPDYSGHKCGVGVAARTIDEGEELTINYREIEEASFLDCKS